MGSAFFLPSFKPPPALIPFGPWSFLFTLSSGVFSLKPAFHGNRREARREGAGRCRGSARAPRCPPVPRGEAAAGGSLPGPAPPAPVRRGRGRARGRLRGRRGVPGSPGARGPPLRAAGWGRAERSEPPRDEPWDRSCPKPGPERVPAEPPRPSRALPGKPRSALGLPCPGSGGNLGDAAAGTAGLPACGKDGAEPRRGCGCFPFPLSYRPARLGVRQGREGFAASYWDRGGRGRSEGLNLGSRYDSYRSWAEVCDGKVKNAWETR